MMNRILEVDETLAYAVIEPGVTQIQLYNYLKKNKSPLWLDCTGSGPEASIIGNTLERGFGHTPYGDHFLNSCGMEVVLGDGRVLRTGYGHYQNSKAQHVFKWGIGPHIDGIFTQSNFGIVTKLGIWLMPEPESCKMFFCSVPNDRDLPAVIDALRPLKLRGDIKSLVHIGNDLRVISSFQRYPWEMAGNKTPISDDLRNYFKKRGGFGAWNISGAIYGTRSQVANGKKEIKKALRNLGSVKFIGATGVGIVRKVAKLLERYNVLAEQTIRLKAVEKVYGLLTGKPTDAFLFGTLWRVKGDLRDDTVDPLEYNTGMMWISPIMPMTGVNALELIDLVNPIFRHYGFEPLITVSLITERAMVSVMTISFDRSNEMETQKAQQCYDELFSLVMEKGYIPYRTSIHSMKMLASNSTVFWDITNEMKNVFDPQRIIAPGRYQPVS
jgi:4-cresol dehydrogenase (hydroxylating)